MPEVSIEVPGGFHVGEQATASFRLDIVENAYHNLARRCRIEGLPSCSDSVKECEFYPDGGATLGIPAHHSGEVTITLTFEDQHLGTRLFGSFYLTIARLPAPPAIVVQDRGVSASGSAVVYRPVSVRVTDTVRVEKMGDRQRVTIKLIDDSRRRSEQPFAELARRGARMLVTTGGGAAKFLQLHSGDVCALGRAYAYQLGAAARAKLQGHGHSRVDWVTCWDDSKVKQLSALLAHSATPSGYRLAVRNVADYSRYKPLLSVDVNSERQAEIPAGAHQEIAVENGTVVELSAGVGVARQRLVEFVFEEIPCGRSLVPVYRTENSTFHVPIFDGSLVEVRFLGVWFPDPERTVLSRILARERQDLLVYFGLEDVALWFRHDALRGCIMVSSNVEFEPC